MKSTVKITRDDLTPMLKELTGKETVKAKRAALNRAANTLTRSAVKTFLAAHPSKPKRTVRGRTTTISREEFNEFKVKAADYSGGVEVNIGGVKRRMYYKKVEPKEANYVDWMPSYILDWFERGTEERQTKGRRTVGIGKRGRKRYRIRVGQGGYRGKITAAPFVDKATAAVKEQIFDNLGKDLAKAIYKVYQKHNKG
jgi:hypothetical protein